MLNIPIVDAHLHFWDVNKLNYSWLNEFPILNQSYKLNELNQAIGSLNVSTLIFVEATCEANQALDEVAYITELAKQDPRLKAIVAFAPLEQGKSVRSHLDKLKKNPLVKGVRRLIQSESDLNFCLQPKFIEGVKLLPDYDFSFDICIHEKQLPAVIRLVEACPQTNFILDHMAKPNIAAKEFSPWQDNLTQLTTFPNVACKISGLLTEASHQTWQINDLTPYISHAINVFGFKRIMFGSDWPVMNLAGSYQRWIQALWDILRGTPSHQLQQFFSDNARAYYRITS